MSYDKISADDLLRSLLQQQAGKPSAQQQAAANTANVTPTYLGLLLTTGNFGTSDLTKTQITANQNNYALGNGTYFRFTTDASKTITGLAGGKVSSPVGRIILVSNVGSFDLVLANQSASSLAANRIVTGTGSDLTVSPDGIAWLRYDTTSNRWRVLSGNSGGGGGASPGGSDGQLQYNDSSAFGGLAGTSTITAGAGLELSVAATASGGAANSLLVDPTVTAAANNDLLNGLYLNPTYADAGKTGVTHYALNIAQTTGAADFGIFTGAAIDSYEATYSQAYFSTISNVIGSLNQGAAKGFNIPLLVISEDNTTADTYSYYAVANATHNSGSKGNVLAMEADVYVSGNGNVLNAIGIQCFVECEGNGSITRVIGVQAQGLLNFDGTPTVTNSFGIRILDSSVNGTLTNNYGLYVRDMSGGSSNWAIKTEGGLVEFGDQVKFAGTNSTGAGAALLGANSPASTLTAPYTWIKAKSSDNSEVWIPCWK